MNLKVVDKDKKQCKFNFVNFIVGLKTSNPPFIAVSQSFLKIRIFRGGLCLKNSQIVTQLIFHN